MQGYKRRPFFLLFEGATSFAQAILSTVSPPLADGYFEGWPENEANVRGGVHWAVLDIADNMSTIVDNMSATSLIESLFPRTRSAIFQHLFLNEDGLHLRELERRSGVNSRHLMRELHSLRDAGILVARKVGNQVIYRLNPACPIYDDLRTIIRKTVGLADQLREELQPFASKIQHAYVYGSNARGDARSDSDVDLMIVGDISLRQLGSAIRSAGKSLNRVVNPTIYTSDEYQDELQADDSFVYRVHNGPRIDLFGGVS